MNKTVSIALAGFSFVIEEHAYIKLSDYLQALRKSLDAKEADEVMYDIEIRIAEIIKENLGKREVVNDDDIEKVIAQIGTPEVINEQEEAYYSEQNQTKSKGTQTEKKQLFRDPEKSKIAGVCAGLAHYIGMDVSFMRFLWIIIAVFSVGFPMVVLYAILWAVVPQADTATDFLKMKGKPIDFDSIKEESIRFANESSQKVGDYYKKNETKIWEITRKVLGFIFAIIAIKMVLAAIFSLLGFSGALFGYPWAFHMADFDEFEFYTFSPSGESKLIFLALVGVALLIPIFIFTALSIKLFSPKTKIRYWGYAVLMLFFLLIGLGVYFGLKEAQKSQFYSGYNDNQENISLTVSPENTLTIDVKKIAVPQTFKAFGNDIFSDERKVFEKDRPDVHIIRRNDIKQPYLVIKKQGRGYNHPINVSVPVEVRNGVVSLPNYISYSYDQRFRDYDVDYEIVIPMETQVVDNSMGEIDIDDDADFDYNNRRNHGSQRDPSPDQNLPEPNVDEPNLPENNIDNQESKPRIN